MQYSAVIPLFNGEKFIVDALDSVVNQTLPPQKIIVVDDNSTDNSCELVKEFATNNSSHRIVLCTTSRNSGTAALPRNLGIQESGESDYIAFLDADDIWHTKKMQRQLELMNRIEADACYTSVKKFKSVYHQPSLDPAKNDFFCRLTAGDFKYNNPIKSCSSMVLKTSIAKAVEFPVGIKYRAIEDYFCWLGIFGKFPEAKIIYIPCPYVGYRQHASSLSSSKLKMIKLRMNTYHYKSKILEKIGEKPAGPYLSEAIYIYNQLAKRGG